MMRRYIVPMMMLGSLVAGVRAAEASEPLTAIVNSYLEIQAQLAADKTDNIKKPAQAIAVEADKMGPSGEPIVAAARAIERAKDLEAAREAFGPLSEAVIAAGKAQGWKDIDARLAFCPMANKSWLQKDGEIRNPYYGSQMLTCGEIKALPK
jgi:hypothetical protein